MSKLFSTSLGGLLAALILALASLQLAAPAEARGGRHHALVIKPMHHHHVRRFHYVAPLVVVAPSYSCSDYWSMWKRTGSSYWRAKYYACIG